MTLRTLLTELLVGVSIMLVGATGAFVGSTRLRLAVLNTKATIRAIRPHLALLAVVLVLNRLARHRSQDISWAIGWNITGLIYRIEGTLVADIQSFATPELTVFFSFIYIYGYVFLTTFPVVAYFAHREVWPFKRLIVAYALNYLIGLIGYTLFISFGPRNLLPNQVDSLLYIAYPSAQLLTSDMNANTNVFPSLHASLSLTVVLLARQTTDTYPVWYPLSVLLAVCIVISTMYLGIHWASDVVAGAVLAIVAVWVANRYA